MPSHADHVVFDVEQRRTSDDYEYIERGAGTNIGYAEDLPLHNISHEEKARRRVRGHAHENYADAENAQALLDEEDMLEKEHAKLRALRPLPGSLHHRRPPPPTTIVSLVLAWVDFGIGR